MDATDLMETLGKKEFRPVELHLTDGRTLPLPHLDYFLMFPSKKTALVFPDGVHFEVVDIASIVRVAPLAAGG